MPRPKNSDFNPPTLPRRGNRKGPYGKGNQPGRALTPVPGTQLLIKRIDKTSGGVHPYCAFDHDWWPQGQNKKSGPLKQKKVADFTIYIIGYPTPMCRACWKEFLALYTSTLPPDYPANPLLDPLILHPPSPRPPF